jgi:L-fucose isomerase-like protein
MPEIKIGIVGVSRDCFPASLTQKRLAALMAELKKQKVNAVACPVIIENEKQALAACDDLLDQGCNAAVAYLGNFGPEGPTTLFFQEFPGPVMACAAAEENKAVLASDRGDALCGLLNCSYNIGLRRLDVYIPQYPVGLPKDLAQKIGEFASIARVVVGVTNLKVFGFGPRPHDFMACNAPIQPIYDLGATVMENSELDLLVEFKKAAKDKAGIKAVAADMAKELKGGCQWPELLPRLAQYELALMNFFENNLGASSFGVFANKCWPAFESEFGFVPCFINSRLAGRGIPVACEVDLYGAISEYMLQCATGEPATGMPRPARRLLMKHGTKPNSLSKAGQHLLANTPNDDAPRLFSKKFISASSYCASRGSSSGHWQPPLSSLAMSAATALIPALSFAAFLNSTSRSSSEFSITVAPRS